MFQNRSLLSWCYTSLLALISTKPSLLLILWEIALELHFCYLLVQADVIQLCPGQKLAKIKPIFFWSANSLTEPVKLWLEISHRGQLKVTICMMTRMTSFHLFLFPFIPLREEMAFSKTWFMFTGQIVVLWSTRPSWPENPTPSFSLPRFPLCHPRRWPECLSLETRSRAVPWEGDSQLHFNWGPDMSWLLLVSSQDLLVHRDVFQMWSLAATYLQLAPDDSGHNQI